MAMRFEQKPEVTHKLALLGQRYTVEQLAESLEFTHHRKVQISDEQHGIITSFSGGKFLVDLAACTLYLWTLPGKQCYMWTCSFACIARVAEGAIYSQNI
jgi:hypothetical protein